MGKIHKTDDSHSMEQLERDVRAAMNELLDENKDHQYPEDLCHEVADAWTPIYTWNIAMYAASDITLLTEVPEVVSTVYAVEFDGSATPLDLIAANIYERLSDVCSDTLDDWRAFWAANREETA